MLLVCQGYQPHEVLYRHLCLFLKQVQLDGLENPSDKINLFRLHAIPSYDEILQKGIEVLAASPHHLLNKYLSLALLGYEIYEDQQGLRIFESENIESFFEIVKVLLKALAALDFRNQKMKIYFDCIDF